MRIPDVLVPYMGGLTFLPFVRESKLAEKPANPPSGAPKAEAPKVVSPAEKEKLPTPVKKEAPSPKAPATTTTPAPAAEAAKKDESKVCFKLY